jgi:hypothetical protein
VERVRAVIIVNVRISSRSSIVVFMIIVFMIIVFMIIVFMIIIVIHPPPPPPPPPRRRRPLLVRQVCNTDLWRTKDGFTVNNQGAGRTYTIIITITSLPPPSGTADDDDDDDDDDEEEEDDDDGDGGDDAAGVQHQPLAHQGRVHGQQPGRRPDLHPQ